MNILPKKRWHVRTKANIERVRRDEAEALEKELKEKKRAQAAEREARIEHLRSKRFKDDGEAQNQRRTDILGSLEKCLEGTNKDHEEECKAEKEKFEKNIGLLTYLGQSAQKPWYLDSHEKRVSKSDEKSDAKKASSMSVLDPLYKMNKYIAMKKKNSSSTKKHPATKKRDPKKTVSGAKSIQDLRAERLERERIERHKANLLLKKFPS